MSTGKDPLTVFDSLSINDLNFIKTLDSSSGYDRFYNKCIYANNIPILSSKNVSNQALIQAKAIIEHIVNGLSPEITNAMLDCNFRIVIKSESEKTTDMPEHNELYKLHPKGDWNSIRGLGATPKQPICSCAEENLLCYWNDPYKGNDVLTHEFAHGVHEMGLRFYDKTFDKKLWKMWRLAKRENLWTGTYAITNFQEYFAYGTQIWFHVVTQSPITNGFSNSIDTREELLKYDPRLYKLMEGVFPAGILEISCNCKK